MKSFEQWLAELDGDNLCQVCSYAATGCTGGVRGGPNGPIFPPCADGYMRDLIVMDAAQEAYAEYCCEDCSGRICTGCEHQHEEKEG